MTRRFEQVASPAPLYRDDPNYPGIPATDPGELTARTKSRATVDYDTYVLRYAARQRGHVLLTTAGITLIIGAVVYLEGAPMVILCAIGMGSMFAGFIGFAIAAAAHDSYTRDLAVSVSETYHRPAQPRPATVRPFIPTDNGTGKTTNTGRLDFTPDVWRNLFDRALANGGYINRDDVAKPARVGREWYHGAGYGALLEELSRLGFIDGRNRLTPAALSWYERQIALPLSSIPLRSQHERTNGANERANGQAGRGQGE